jgi:hypothetical protein
MGWFRSGGSNIKPKPQNLVETSVDKYAEHKQEETEFSQHTYLFVDMEGKEQSGVRKCLQTNFVTH